MALAESRETVIADCQAIHPTILNGVPYFYDQVYRGLCETGHAEDARRTARRCSAARSKSAAPAGRRCPIICTTIFTARACRCCKAMACPNRRPSSRSRPRRHIRRGSCGRAIPGIEVRIADDGEILTRGPHVMLGYYENPAATAEVLKDGWLATGDLGRLDDDGFLYITGRKKEILVTLGGKNIAPVYLESLLTAGPADPAGDGRRRRPAVPGGADRAQSRAAEGRTVAAAASPSASPRRRFDASAGAGTVRASGLPSG